MPAEVYAPALDVRKLNDPVPEGYDRRTAIIAREKEIVNNLLRYVAEFRLGVKFDEYFYREETNGLTGERYFASLEQGPILNIFRKAITERQMRGLSTAREVAECLGFQSLQQNLTSAPEKTMFVWVSPPGRREDGYGAYSFTFVGQVIKDEGSEERKVRFIPYRNILSMPEHNNYLQSLTSDGQTHHSAEDFLAHPVIFSPITGGIDTPEDIIRIIGEQERINTGWFPRLAILLDPFIQGYLGLLRSGADLANLRHARDAIENIAIAHRDEILYALQSESAVPQLFTLTKPVFDIFRIWGEKAPQFVGGSCPPTEELSVSSGIILGEMVTLMDYQAGLNMDGFTCPNCRKAKVKGNSCSMCGITKEKWAEKTGIRCA